MAGFRPNKLLPVVMAGTWTDERRASARAVAQRVKPWLHSTGPRTAAGKAVVAMNAYRGGLRPKRRVARREAKATIAALDQLLAWEEMEARIDAWLRSMRVAGQRPTTKAMKAAGLKELRPPTIDLSEEDLAWIFAPLASESIPFTTSPVSGAPLTQR